MQLQEYLESILSQCLIKKAEHLRHSFKIIVKLNNIQNFRTLFITNQLMGMKL